MSKIQLHVKSLTGKETVINCLNNITVYDLKKLINNEEAYMLRLLHKNKELEDEQFLNQIDIKNGSVIFCLIKLNKEVEILLEIKRNMNLEVDWSKDVELSEWVRIEIDVQIDSKFKVTSLDLSWLNLTGEIPKEIGKLINLECLDLSNNQLTGEIPKEIGKLTNLQELFLDNNQLIGEIPIEIGKLMNLILLNLSYNQLTGEIPKEIGKLHCYKKF